MPNAYLKYFFVFVALGAVSIAFWNWLVNPFSIYRSPVIAGFNEDKIEYLRYLRLTKAYGVLRARPDAVILGTSRSGRGLSPNHTAWGSSVVYNLAVPAGSMYENLRLLQHAHASSGLGQVLLGLDFRLFNESYVNRAFSEDRMLVRATGERNTAVYSTILADLFGTLLSLDALQGSVNTVRFQGWNAETLFAGGRWDRKNPAYNHQDAFRAYTNASIRRFSKVPDSLEGLEDFRRLVRFAHREEIDVRMFISPSHVIHWLLVQRMGLWPRFQQLKRELVKINIDEARRVGRDPFPLWDFSGVNSVTVEPVPPDREDEHMEWFWESVHYKAALGDVILEKVLARQERSGVIDDFGVNLVQIDLEGHLASQSQRLADFFDKESPEVRFVNELVAAYRN